MEAETSDLGRETEADTTFQYGDGRFDWMCYILKEASLASRVLVSLEQNRLNLFPCLTRRHPIRPNHFLY